MLTTSTHDTKRSEDVRARMVATSAEFPCVSELNTVPQIGMSFEPWAGMSGSPLITP